MGDRSDERRSAVGDDDRNTGRTSTLRTDGAGHRSGGEPDRNYVVGAIAVYGAVALGAFVTAFLFLTMADRPALTGGMMSQPTMGSVPEDDQFFFAVAGTFNRVLQVGLLVAVVLGVYVSRTIEAGRSAAGVSAAAAGVGIAATLVVLVALLVLTAPDPVDPDVADLFEPVLAVTIGAGIAAGGTAAAVERWL